jgi:hypothetical protein
VGLAHTEETKGKETMKDESHLDRWNDGAIDGFKGVAPRNNDADYLSGHAEGKRDRKVRVVVPARPEGYYHLPVGTFD